MPLATKPHRIMAESRNRSELERGVVAPLEVLHESHDLLAVSKPAGLLCHFSRCVEGRDSVIQRLRSIPCRANTPLFLAHRLDRPTSGALVIAKNRDTARELGRLFREQRVEKTYLALVRGRLTQARDIDHPVHVEGVDYPSQTRVEPLGEIEIPRVMGKFPTAVYTQVKLVPQTGRTHQLRCHMKHISHPIVGDTTYGDGRHNRLFRELGFGHLWLHCSQMSLNSLREAQPLLIQSPLPDAWNPIWCGMRP